MKSKVLGVIAIVITSVLGGCTVAPSSTNKPQETTVNSTPTTIITSQPESTYRSIAPTVVPTQQPGDTSEVANEAKITKDDFNIRYNGTTINDSTSFKEIAGELGIKIGKVDDNIYIKAGTQSGDWYLVDYPNKNSENLRIEYVTSEVFGTYIVSVDLYNVKTNRNIGVGDSEQRLLAAYGDTVEPIDNGDYTVCYKYPLSNDQSKVYSEDKVITFIVDKLTKKVTEIYINYNNYKAMDDLDITSFD